MENPFIRITNVSHRYGASSIGIEPQVLKSVNLEIAQAEDMALLGRSGSGKSTLLNLLAGVETIQQGEICIDGQNLANLNDAQLTSYRRHQVGYVYQFFHLIPTLTVSENIALPLELNNWSRSSTNERLNYLLQLTGLRSKASKFIDQLSGGEQQRVAIARAIVHKPKLVLADEPTGNLDTETAQAVMQLMKELVQNEKATLLTVTHSLAVAKNSDRIVTLEGGNILERQGNFAW